MRNMIGKYEKYNWSPIKESYNLANNQDQTCICNQPDQPNKTFLGQNSWNNIKLFWQMHLAIWTNTFDNLEKYNLQLRQMHFTMQTNTFCSLGLSSFWV